MIAVVVAFPKMGLFVVMRRIKVVMLVDTSFLIYFCAAQSLLNEALPRVLVGSDWGDLMGKKSLRTVGAWTRETYFHEVSMNSPSKTGLESFRGRH